MKKLIITLHIIFGCFFIYFGIIGLLLLLTHEREIKMNVLRIIFGLVSIIGGVLFIKNNRWANWIIPLVPLSLFIWAFFGYKSAINVGRGEDFGITGASMFIIAFISLVVFAVEALYLRSYKRNQGLNS